MDGRVVVWLGSHKCTGEKVIGLLEELKACVHTLDEVYLDHEEEELTFQRMYRTLEGLRYLQFFEQQWYDIYPSFPICSIQNIVGRQY